MKKILLSFFIGVMLIACNQKTVFVREVWTKEQANEWYKQWGWLRGCDFIPSTAINQMEMWQADTFDPVTIDRELGWAEDIGMNCMRVYLHHLVWETDKEGFKKRINEYLTIANLAPQLIRIDFAVFPETKSQGLFHQIQKAVTFCRLPHGADA